VRLALLADVHGNLEALTAVLADLDRRAPDAALVCAGDLVGYGPDPDACIERLRDRGASCVGGNHEEMVLGRRDFARCVRAGIVAALWTRAQLGDAARRFLGGLPARCTPAAGVVVCHGDLRSADTYVSDAPRAAAALLQLQADEPAARLLVCGHTHRRMVFGQDGGPPVSPGDVVVPLPRGQRCLVNPGAVGQARAGGPVASYAVLDLDRATVAFVAVGYAHAVTVRKMRRAGLVPRVVLTPPRNALSRRIEHLRLRWTRHRAEQAARTAVPPAP
jgi:predicted phosphodiesterase